MRRNSHLPACLMVSILFAPGAVAQVIHIEAESGTLSGFSIMENEFFSHGAAITAQVANPVATYTFAGWDGPYDITVAYCDEDDGSSSYILSGSSSGSIASWQGDQPTGEILCNPDSLLTREIVTSVALEQGETITLDCQRDGDEPCRVDVFDFTYVGTMPPVGARAFPGAKGFGAFASGARGLDADVCVVSTLADSGPGSFRACARWPSPAYVTFAVSGYIDLAEPVSITGNKTIECGTAPGDGVVFRKASVDVVEDNVILRGCRAWAGKEGPGGEPLVNRDGIFVGANDTVVHHVIVANCSTMFATDENIGTWYEVENVTFQHNISAWATGWRDEADNRHASKGMLIGNNVATVSVVENYLAFNGYRNPLVGPEPQDGPMVTPIEIVNNLIYCYGAESVKMRASVSAHIIGNQFRPCPSQYSTPNEIVLKEGTLAYLDDNRMDDGSAATVDIDGTSEASPEPLFTSLLTPVSAGQVETHVCTYAGPANLKGFELDAFERYRDGWGTRVESVDELGGWPVLQGGANPPDSDSDGLPDWWETTHCGGSCSPTGDHDSDGYENIEEWFHGIYAAVSFPVWC